MFNNFCQSIKKQVSLFILGALVFSPFYIQSQEEKVVFYAMLSPKNEGHRLYSKGDKDVPHPFAMYQDRAKDPMYSYDNACGFGAFLFDPATNELEYAISYSGLSGRPIMMHFHLGKAGAEGPVIQTIFGHPYEMTGPVGTSAAAPLNGKEAPKGRSGFVSGKYKLIGNKTLSPALTGSQEAEDLMNGKIYVNIHTYLNEAGEMRGQIIQCNK